MLYLEEPSPLFTVKLETILYTLLLSLQLLLLSLLLPLPFIHCPHVGTLPHSRSPTHTLHAHLTHHPVPERGDATLTTMATADAGDPSTELQPPPLSLKSPVWKYFGFSVSYLDNVRVVDIKPQFANSAETRWQVVI